MKSSVLVVCLGMWLESACSADGSPVKSCSTVLVRPDDNTSVPTMVTIYDRQGALVAEVAQTQGGQSSSYSDAAAVSNHSIRAGLTPNSADQEGLNYAESLIVQAMVLSTDPVFHGAYGAGFDLSAARTAQVFQIGQSTNMGSMAIVDAQDAAGKELGSFLGGFLVSPCQ